MGTVYSESSHFWLDNILFNLPYDEERYHKTLEVCALLSDLEILEDGDESEIGERGVSYLPHCGKKALWLRLLIIYLGQLVRWSESSR